MIKKNFVKEISYDRKGKCNEGVFIEWLYVFDHH